MNKIIYGGLICSLSFYAALGVAHAADPAVLEFVKPLPVIPATIDAGTTDGPFTYTIKNNVNATVEIEVSVLDASGDSDNSIVKRTGGNCGKSIKAHGTCTLIYSITAPDTANETIKETLVVEPEGRTGYEITSKIQFEVTGGVPGATLAYIVNFSSDTVSKCSIDTSGLLTCSNAAAANITSPAGITFATVNSQKYAYITNINAGTITQCTIVGPGPTAGNLNCAAAGGVIASSLFGIALFTDSNLNTSAYLSHNSGTTKQIIKCPVDTLSGVIATTGCTPTNLAEPPGLLTLQSFGGTTYLYTGNLMTSGTKVFRCIVSSMDGSLSGCQGSGDVPNNLVGYQIAFAQVGGIAYGYVTAENLGNNEVFKCQVDTTTGLLMNGCVSTGSNFDVPTGIAGTTISGTQYMYVTNQNNGVTLCSIVAAGALSCGVSGATGLNTPVGIALQ